MRQPAGNWSMGAGLYCTRSRPLLQVQASAALVPPHAGSKSRLNEDQGPRLVRCRRSPPPPNCCSRFGFLHVRRQVLEQRLLLGLGQLVHLLKALRQAVEDALQLQLLVVRRPAGPGLASCHPGGPLLLPSCWLGRWGEGTARRSRAVAPGGWVVVPRSGMHEHEAGRLRAQEGFLHLAAALALWLGRRNRLLDVNPRSLDTQHSLDDTWEAPGIVAGRQSCTRTAHWPTWRSELSQLTSSHGGTRLAEE